MAARRMLVLLVAALLGGGAAVGTAACGEDGGGVEIQGETGTGRTGTGSTGTSGSGTSTAATVDTAATDPAALAAAMAQVARYARGQTAALVTAAVSLDNAVDAGSIPAARRAYARARPYYERIEPLVALFPELDGKIDAREDDFPRKAEDPTWTGFHPIERMLWKDSRITARTRRLAAGLVSDTRRLDELMGRRKVPPAVVIPGIAELVDEVEESKITGEEERYSKLDLPTFLANLEGSRQFYRPLSKLVHEKDPELADEIDSAFDDAFAEVAGLRRSGRFVAYDELSSGQQRALKQRIEALAEPLARVQGVLGVRS
jgi:iron uptake system component EfeO